MPEANDYSRRAAFFEIEYIDDADYDFWRSFIAGPGYRMLDVPCAIGLRATYLAKAGAAVTGVDLEPAMIAKFRDRLAAAGEGLPIRAEVGDMRDLDLGERFDLVFVAREAFQYLPDDTQALSALRALSRHLDAGGRLVVDLADFPNCRRNTPHDLIYYDPGVADDVWVRDWSRITADGVVCTRWHRQLHEDGGFVASELHYEESFGGETRSEWRARMRFRRYRPKEFLSLVENAGLSCGKMYGGYDGRSYEDGDPRMIFELSA